MPSGISCNKIKKNPCCSGDHKQRTAVPHHWLSLPDIAFALPVSWLWKAKRFFPVQEYVSDIWLPQRKPGIHFSDPVFAGADDGFIKIIIGRITAILNGMQFSISQIVLRQYIIVVVHDGIRHSFIEVCFCICIQALFQVTAV